ncbi:glycerol-3-phosphate responsive antiterminator [Candidatus Izemoplasma sp. B36]|uniref:glycerol-3-phosphate responsive antiterminator n=1 Tax=Candidatus Izemoplasma sp. B36 TaxID=3242468 RepID=UPI0035590519
MLGQRIIPAIHNHKRLNSFLKSNLKYGILMNFQLAQLEELVKAMKKYNKKVLVHSELIKGLSSDEYGAIYLIQSLNVDGIISSKTKVIEVCKKRNVIGVYRFFLKDSLSLSQSISIGQKLRPDFVEILPSHCYNLIGEIKQKLSCEVLVGGLVKDYELAQKCFDHGALALTTSSEDLWYSF